MPDTPLVVGGTTDYIVRGLEIVPDRLAIWQLADGHLMLTRPIDDAIDARQVSFIMK